MTTKPNTMLFLHAEKPLCGFAEADTPWLCAKDVCEHLQIANHNDAMASIPAAERMLVPIDTAGGEQHVNFISETAVYRLAFRSSKREAIAFQNWVCGEVLPAIRRQGYYSPGQDAFLRLVREQTAIGVSPDLAARTACRILQYEATPAGRAALAAHRPAQAEDAAPCPYAPVINPILAGMKPDTDYTLPAIVDLLPLDHPLANLDLDHRLHSSLGLLLRRAVSMGRLEKVPRRRLATYRLPKIVQIRPAKTP
jgi:hypothetical protein